MISRGLRLLSRPFFRKRVNVNAIQPTRNLWLYREVLVDAPRWEHLLADGLNCFMWWWIFVHLYYQSGHVLGEYDYPEPDKWSDAELGVVDE